MTPEDSAPMDAINREVSEIKDEHSYGNLGDAFAHWYMKIK